MGDSRKFDLLVIGSGPAGESAALNAANEVAVAAFLDGQIAFTAIPKIISAVMDRSPLSVLATLADVLAADRVARELAERAIAERSWR